MLQRCPGATGDLDQLSTVLPVVAECVIGWPLFSSVEEHVGRDLHRSANGGLSLNLMRTFIVHLNRACQQDFQVPNSGRGFPPSRQGVPAEIRRRIRSVSGLPLDSYVPLDKDSLFSSLDRDDPTSPVIEYFAQLDLRPFSGSRALARRQTYLGLSTTEFHDTSLLFLLLQSHLPPG